MIKLVILPGWGGSHKTWQKFVDVAKEDFDVRVIDLPCFGDEPCPSNIWGVEEYAAFVNNKIGDLELENSDLVLLGHSFGGQVAVCLASKNPKLANKLILSGAAVIRPRIRIKRVIFGFLAKIGKIFFKLPLLNKLEKIGKNVLYKAADSPDYSETSGIKRDIYKKIIRQDFTKELENVKIPTLVTWGNKDKMTPLRHGKKIADLLPNSKFHLFKNGRHGLHNQMTDEYLKVIEDFVYAESD